MTHIGGCLVKGITLTTDWSAEYREFVVRSKSSVLRCLLYCMMENMNMFGPDRTTLDPISSVRHAGPYLENYDQEKMIKCIDQVNLMEFKDNARARCDKSAIFLTCFNKGIFRLSWEHLLMEAAERCKKKLGIQSCKTETLA
uniref:Uncharacterized protein n=1 Tax=Timema bartmani TaxID=61472 RepID=A0A7R9I574_9NEOP|nr:unnamed protein product [Timema bartmani]